jgi:peroxiredoxin
LAIARFMVPLGTPAPEFALPAVGGGQVRLAEITAPALLVAFLCNHCPYVRHIESAFAAVVAAYADKGLATVGIASNDVNAYPEDGEAGLASQISRAGFSFPYLLDGTQQIAIAYRAACTPDLFLYDAQRRLAYRGAFDASRPHSPVPVTGDLLISAIQHVLRGEPVPEPHRPSLGCSLKWKPGNDASTRAG